MIKVKLKDEVDEDEDEEEKKKDDEEEKKVNGKEKVERSKNKSNTDIARQISDPDSSNKTPDMEAGEEEELKQIKQYEKTVQIRLCNYSMLMRA